MYPQEEQYILQKAEQENLMGYSHTGNSHSTKVAHLTMWLGFQRRNLIQITTARGEEDILQQEWKSSLWP